MSEINQALMLMIVGMGTVFIVLLLVIYCSKGLIILINRWFPEKEIISIDKATEIPTKTIAVITTAICSASKGAARIIKIEKK